MGVAVWMASMVGYDKIIQLLKQISDVTPGKEDADDSSSSGTDDNN